MDIKKLRELYRQTGKKKLRIALGSGKCLCTAICTEYDDNGDTEFVADCLPDYVLQENILVAEDHRPFMNYIVAACNALPELLDEIEWYEQNKTQLEQQVDELIDENDRLRTEIKKVIEKAKNNNPYPTDIFPELSKEEVSKLREVFKEKGISQIRLYASWGRKVWDDCLQEIESFLEVEE